MSTKLGAIQYRVITTIEEALCFLLNQWPMENGVAYDAVRKACLEGAKTRIAPAGTLRSSGK
ncbi:DUF982 domain-containing protein [Labrys sp. KB_33_2]|uniref:DUF982 domain-containing protein n=1 Tax=Labrys sp. KB_33_2 TaxID=3237479 RepID=UPI003F8EBBDD